MANDSDFLTHYGWAFAEFKDARAAIDKAPEYMRSDMQWSVEVSEKQLREDLTRVVDRAGEIARRLRQIAVVAAESQLAPVPHD